MTDDREKELPFRNAELKRLLAEGEASGLSDESGEVFLARLEAKYRAMLERSSLGP